MCPTRQFFNTFLEARGLPNPTGKRLYEYGCDDDEYETLRDILQDHGDPGHLRLQHDGHGQVIVEIPDWGHADADDVIACFILYSSEWYKRWDAPRRRTWAQLLGQIGWRRRDYSELYQAIAYGLRRWRRPVIKMPGSTRYFDTIGHEAGVRIEGFPLTEYKLVSQDEWQARYEACDHPDGFQPGEFEVRIHSDEDAPERIIGLFYTGLLR